MARAEFRGTGREFAAGRRESRKCGTRARALPEEIACAELCAV